MAVVTRLERLREVALDQHGFVTTAQAVKEGVSHAELSAMVARDLLDPVAHGVYRKPQVAETEFDQYQLAVLCTGVSLATTRCWLCGIGQRHQSRPYPPHCRSSPAYLSYRWWTLHCPLHRTLTRDR
ncbi:hypothetical protein DIJ64_09045 [Mycobacterium leprae]|uniref:AbiEi antitoxin N-terminal domain-containing protein n=1 Tax=Mycobacterium leprae TaxID=1769 RepID=A0AAD0KUE6_MYCLR|nr:hypothetical protein DIJ64_09045 [Mycobacterium leprae]